ncbi:8-oxoguanine glycosylase ogg1 [Cryptotrichosporon argae]
MSSANLSLANTLPVGQSFLWHRHALDPVENSGADIKPDANADAPTEEYSRAVWPGRVVLLRQTRTHVHYTSVLPDADDTAEPRAAPVEPGEDAARAWLDDYFQLARYPDLEGMYADWRARDPGLFGKTELDERAVGVRVLRQDPWECLIAFITSTNNHIPRITSLMHKLSQHYSPPLLSLPHPSTGEDVVYHLFPRPHALPATLELTLRALGFGYRAGFIESTLGSLRAAHGGGEGEVERALEAWRRAPADEVRDRLVALKGVGRKVADCVMLMCLDQPALIPVDTHVSAIAARHPAFPSRLRNKPMSKHVYDEVQAFLADAWGPMGGWCQAVMFAADLAPKAASRPGTPTRTKTKRSADAGSPTPVAPLTPTALSSGDPYVDTHVKKRLGDARDLPGAGGFKRTRSATRVALLRTESGASASSVGGIDGALAEVKVEEKP